MKNILFPLVLFAVLASCHPDELTLSDDPNLSLTISHDTLVFDTLMTSRGSITERFRIYNPHKEAVSIDRISLGGGLSSPYSLVVNGKSGTHFENEVLYGGDSILVLVDVLIDPVGKNQPFLVKDSVLIEHGNFQADVKLIAWGQEAIFFGKGVLCDALFTADVPYVFYDTVLIDQNCLLQIEAGARLYFDKNAALLVWGNMLALGDSTNPIVFRNSRFDEDYQIAPGQWPGIYFVQGSTDNVLDYVIIENAANGITIGTPDQDSLPDLSISHSIIRHSAETGLRGFTSDILGSNLLIYNAGSQTVLNAAGGNYRYEHCTFVNAPNFFFQEEPSVQIADYLFLGNGETLSAPLSLEMVDCIVWGNSPEELFIGLTPGLGSSVTVVNNIIRSDGAYPNNYLSTEPNFPGFVNMNEFDYRLDSTSIAIDKAIPPVVADDLSGQLRDELPDLGAYEYVGN